MKQVIAPTLKLFDKGCSEILGHKTQGCSFKRARLSYYSFLEISVSAPPTESQGMQKTSQITLERVIY